MRIGLQLYTLRDFLDTREDFFETVQRVAEMGFEGVEIAGVGCLGSDLTPAEAATCIKAAGMTVTGVHRDWSGLELRLDQEIDLLKTLTSSYVALPDPPKGLVEGGIPAFRSWLAVARHVSDRLNDVGLTLAYHNHAADFQRHRPYGQRPYDVLIEEAPWLAMEMDTFWVHHSGSDVVATIKRLKDRIPCVHVKDVAPFGWEVSFAPVGEGNLNWEEILPSLEEAGTEWLIVEQDQCRRDPFQSIESSLSFLREYLGKVPREAPAWETVSV
jgi:sugar phosphate isomerase/epimerase